MFYTNFLKSQLLAYRIHQPTASGKRRRKKTRRLNHICKPRILGSYSQIASLTKQEITEETRKKQEDTNVEMKKGKPRKREKERERERSDHEPSIPLQRERSP
ncbi:hypothetical protein HPP92_008018 [Vanilla planifolia]|uniref:Uncharacterized protein n=1 Tax=Vanilla planifolia TaxID=51239 RepID=A0A835VBS2_VANPL|nr:hypothetical protein HPP92_008018 [Vanilla planifolia]